MSPGPTAGGDGAPRIALLGAPQLIDAGGVAHALGPLSAALLLLAARRGPMPRDDLAALLWPDDEPPAALGKLRQRLFHLKQRAAAPLWAPGTAVALAPEVQHDLQPDQPEAPALLPPWTTRFDQAGLLEALQDEGRRWTREVVAHGFAQADAAESRLDGAGLLRLAHRLVDAAPDSDRAGILEMKALALLGDPNAAQLAYERLSRRLDELLGERPSDEATRVALAIAARSYGRPARLTVGRAPLLATLRARLERRRVVLLAGPAGMGKTHLIDELATGRRSALACRCLPSDRAVPWGALRRLAASVLQGLQAEPGAGHARLRAFSQGAPAPAPLDVLEALQAALAIHTRQSTDTLVVVDDLHFADDDSVHMIGQLLDHPDRPAWLLSVRTESMPAPLRDWLLAQAAGDEAQVNLEPLQRGDLVDWLRALGATGVDTGAWADSLARHCGGHPLHTLQVLHEVGAFVARMAPVPPPSLPVPRDALLRLARRLDRCDAQARRLAFIVAVAGDDFGRELAKSITGWDVTTLAGPWQQLEDAGLLRGRQFTHELVRQAVLEMLPAELAPEMHERVAIELGALGAPPARRVAHWVAAGRWAEAAADALRAADDALASGLRMAARGLRLQAAEHLERCGRQAEASALRAQVVPMTLALLSADLARCEAEALLAGAGDDSARVAALLARSQVAAESREGQALSLALRALALAGQLADPMLQRRATLRVAVALYVEQDAAAALECLATLQRLRHGMAPEEAEEYDDMRATLLAAVGRRAEAAERWLAALAASRGGSNPSRTADHAGNAAIQLGYLCRTEEALVLCEEAAEIERRLQSTASFSAVNLLSIAALCMDTGRYGRAVAMGEEGLRLLGPSGLPHFVASVGNVLGGCWLRLGQAGRAAAVLTDMPAQSPPWVQALRRAKQGMLAAALGKPALPLFDQALDWIDGSGIAFPPLARWRIVLERATAEDPALTLQPARDCALWAHSVEYLALERQARCVELRALLALGDTAAAAQRADALAVACAPDWQAFDFDRVDLWRFVIQAWDAVGRRAEADALARLGAEWIRRTAAQEVPAAWRSSFLTHNPANRWLLQRDRTP